MLDENRDRGVRSFTDSTTVVLMSRLAMMLAVPALIWVMASINAMQADIAVMKSQIQAGTDDRYHASEATRDFALRDAQISRDEADIGKLYTIANTQSQNIAGIITQMEETNRRLAALEAAQRGRR